VLIYRWAVPAIQEGDGSPNRGESSRDITEGAVFGAQGRYVRGDKGRFFNSHRGDGSSKYSGAVPEA